MAMDAQDRFNTAREKGDKIGMAANAVALYGGAVGTGASAAAAAGGTDAKGKPIEFNETMMSGIWGKTAGEHAAAIATGVATMGISVGVSAAIAGIGYLFRDRSMTDVARDAGQDFGAAFGKETMDAIKADIESGMTEVGAELNNLSRIIKDAGGLTASNFGRMTGKSVSYT